MCHTRSGETLAHRLTACSGHDCIERKADVGIVTLSLSGFIVCQDQTPQAMRMLAHGGPDNGLAILGWEDGNIEEGSGSSLQMLLRYLNHSGILCSLVRFLKVLT